ncbi:MAG TPA: S8 family serine peptidase, partial [Lacipirellulaceae bacterium]|nr:S8 family serine peptidase [Lacipirellulaceae bacterium]
MARQLTTRPRFTARIEHLEDRRVMSADPLADLMGWLDSTLDDTSLVTTPPPVEPMSYGHDQPAFTHTLVDNLPPPSQHVLGDPDFWIDTSRQTDWDSYFDQVDQMLNEAHNLTGWFNVRSNYGFTGLGQTVAVIDSGIAWDHFALGGGFGQGYRVVGGWDFTEENDANPYDDGPSGSHGTHVAGIIGNNSANHPGVAPGVDLVALRVFNDAGQGFFSWIENALRWVYTNRNNFANPITAVNLSLGVSSWNSAAIPTWANLEDEFAMLKSAGIFISVSAGNSFASYNSPGLSYPAASQYVVPVMSTNDAGQLSSFSQRLGRAIAAPGQNIVSTVPDYNGNQNGVADDFGSKGGTSMAAPYVAGASVLIRQAMQFVGMTNINQDTIYNHMMATADSVLDPATNQTYKRLNLARAIDALMPADDYGSTPATAHNMGTLVSSLSLNGQVAKLTDVDCFRFTAAASGKVTFSVTSSLGMTPTWQVWGGSALPSAPGTVSFNVIAGQSYTVGLSSPGGLGNYALSALLENSTPFVYTDWGAVTYNQINDLNVSGETWYRVTASRSGSLTAVGWFNQAGGNVQFDLYNANLQLIAGGVTSAGQARADVVAAQGATYYLRVTGSNSDVDVKLLNLLTHTGTSVAIGG